MKQDICCLEKGSITYHEASESENKVHYLKDDNDRKCQLERGSFELINRSDCC